MGVEGITMAFSIFKLPSTKPAILFTDEATGISGILANPNSEGDRLFYQIENELRNAQEAQRLDVKQTGASSKSWWKGLLI